MTWITGADIDKSYDRVWRAFTRHEKAADSGRWATEHPADFDRRQRRIKHLKHKHNVEAARHKALRAQYAIQQIGVVDGIRLVDVD
jgi:mannose/cellobiose epimerase-like protein (N-acyl-D-glucosamine 2-epimerase family)